MMWMNGYNGERQTQESEQYRPRAMADAMALEIAIALSVFFVIEPALIGRGLGVAMLAAVVAWAWWISSAWVQVRLVKMGYGKNKQLKIFVTVFLMAWFAIVFAALNIEWLKILNRYWWPVWWSLEDEKATLQLFGNMIQFEPWLMSLRLVIILCLPVLALPYCPLMYRQFMEIIFPMYANSKFNNISPASIWNPFFNVTEGEPEKPEAPPRRGAVVVNEWQEARDGGGVKIRREEISHLTDDQWRYLAHAILDLGLPFTEEALAGKDKPLSGPEFRKLKELWITSKRLEKVGRNSKQGYKITQQGLLDLQKWSPTDNDEDDI